MTPEAQLALLAILATAIPAIIAAWVSVNNSQQIRDAQVHLLQTKATVDETKEQIDKIDKRVLDIGVKTDGKLTQLLDTSIAAANAAGRVEGTEIERQRIATEKTTQDAAVVAALSGQIVVAPIDISVPTEPKLVLPN